LETDDDDDGGGGPTASSSSGSLIGGRAGNGRPKPHPNSHLDDLTEKLQLSGTPTGLAEILEDAASKHSHLDGLEKTSSTTTSGSGAWAQRFKAWMKLHGKVYANDKERLERATQFRATEW